MVGLGCPRPGEYAIARQPIPPLPPIEMKKIPADHQLSTHMSDDWIRYISFRLPDISKHITTESLKSVMIHDNYSSVHHDIGYGPNFKKYKKDWSDWIKVNVQVGHTAQRIYNKDSGVDIFDWTGITDLKQIADFVLNKQAQYLEYHHIKLQIRSILENPKSFNIELNSGIAAVARRLACRSLFKDISTTS